MSKNYQVPDSNNEDLSIRNVQLHKVEEMALAIESAGSSDEIFRTIVDISRSIPGISLVIIQQVDKTGEKVTTLYQFRVQDPAKLQALYKLKTRYGIDPDEDKLDDIPKLSIKQIPFLEYYLQKPGTIEAKKLSEILNGFWTIKYCDTLQKILEIKKLIICPIHQANHNWGAMIFGLSDAVPLDILEMIRLHCTVALNNISNLERLERRNQELCAINSIARKISSSLEINDIINQTIQEMTSIYKAHGVSVYLLDEETRMLKLAGQYGMTEEIKKQAQAYPLNHPFARIFTSDDDLFTGDMNDYLDNFALPRDFKKSEISFWFMTTVLVVEGRKIGTITVIRPGKEDFSADERNLLISIANQLSIAIENARLHQTLMQRINDLESAKNQLAYSEAKLRLTLDSISEGIMVTSLDGRIMQANPAAIAIHGYDKNEKSFIGKSSLLWVDWNDRRRMLNNLKNIKENDICSCTEFTLIRKDGRRFPAECTISTYKNFLGKPDGFVICIRDISERKEAEKRLLDGERRYRLITENTTDYIVTLTTSGYLKYVSPSHLQLGYDPQVLSGKQCLEIVHPEDRKKLVPILMKFAQMDREDLARLKKQNYTLRLEYRVGDHSGIWHNIEATLNIINSWDSESFDLLLIERDVTERQHTEDKLKQLYNSEKEARNSLEQEIKRRAEFFRALVHELKTPLTPILVSSETIMEMEEKDIFKKLARNVFDGAKRLNNRVDELIDISRGEMGILKIKQEPVKIDAMIKDVARSIQPQITQKHLNLIIDLAPQIPVTLGDELRLRQILQNLLDNAMKFTPAGGEISVQAIADTETIMVKVKDTGCGIDTADQERLFQPYNRVEADRQLYSGLGLGLSLCKQLIVLHGGRIWIESQKGKGTSFFFTLPVKETAALPAKANDLVSQ